MLKGLVNEFLYIKDAFLFFILYFIRGRERMIYRYLPYQSVTSGRVEYMMVMRELCLGNSANLPRTFAIRGVIVLYYDRSESGISTVSQKHNF